MGLAWRVMSYTATLIRIASLLGRGRLLLVWLSFSTFMKGTILCVARSCHLGALGAFDTPKKFLGRRRTLGSGPP